MDGNGFGRWRRHGGGIGRRRWESALGGGVGRQLKMQRWCWCWAAPAAEEHATMASVSVSLKLRANYNNIASALARTGREDKSNVRDVHWKQWQGDKCIVAAVAVVAVRIRQKCQQGEGKGLMVPDQHRQGKGNATMVSP
jgi:hypothetical protein